MKIAFTLLALAGLSYFVWEYRDRIKEWLPGLKTYIWNGLLALAGILTPILNYLGTIDFSKFFTGDHAVENAALAALVVGVVGILLSLVTKRPDEAA